MYLLKKMKQLITAGKMSLSLAFSSIHSPGEIEDDMHIIIIKEKRCDTASEGSTSSSSAGFMLLVPFLQLPILRRQLFLQHKVVNWSCSAEGHLATYSVDGLLLIIISVMLYQQPEH